MRSKAGKSPVLGAVQTHYKSPSTEGLARNDSHPNPIRGTAVAMCLPVTRQAPRTNHLNAALPQTASRLARCTDPRGRIS